MLNNIERAVVRDIVFEYAEGYADAYSRVCIDGEEVWDVFMQLQTATRIARGLKVEYTDALDKNGILHTNGYLHGGVV